MKKTISFIIGAICALGYSVFSFPFYQSPSTEMCGQISDYTFEDGHSNIIVSNRSAVKKAVLTFDDGPCNKYTPEILDILKKHNVKATFFIIGKNAEKYPGIIKRIYDEGHEIGNHTYSHPSTRQLGTEELNSEISKTQQILYELTGKTPKLFRPPGGYLSNNIVETIISNGCKPVLWSWRQDTLDWKCPPVQDVVDIVINNIQNGDIILFHDYNSGISPTPKALEIIIPKLKSLGYELITIEELTSM